MTSNNGILTLFALVLIIWFFIRILKRIFTKPKVRLRTKRKVLYSSKRKFLTHKTKSRSEYHYKKLISKFKRKHNKEPSKNERVRMAIHASHIVIKYRKGKSGHWGRQKIRKYLLEKHGVVDKFRMR
tara:strand:- start:5649 stop:6029 length:381 start_codon:yes stop_codon:yes gene_type:complete